MAFFPEPVTYMKVRAQLFRGLGLDYTWTFPYIIIYNYIDTIVYFVWHNYTLLLLWVPYYYSLENVIKKWLENHLPTCLPAFLGPRSSNLGLTGRGEGELAFSFPCHVPLGMPSL